jgi:hypothetical protein
MQYHHPFLWFSIRMKNENTMISNERCSEFFRLFSLSGKLAGIIGSLVLAWVGTVAGISRAEAEFAV